MVGEKVRDARGQRLGLAGTWGREDLQNWSGRGDGLALSGIEAIEDGVHDISRRVRLHGGWLLPRLRRADAVSREYILTAMARRSGLI